MTYDPALTIFVTGVLGYKTVELTPVQDRFRISPGCGIMSPD